MDYRREHAGVDSIAVLVSAIVHVFRAKGGELHLVAPTTNPRDSTDQNRRAIERGFDAADGKASTLSRITEITFTTWAKLLPSLASCVTTVRTAGRERERERERAGTRRRRPLDRSRPFPDE
jgi:hypothetical protein